MQNIFKRIEQKYILNEEKYLELNKILNKYFNKDKYYKSEIYNIYFDNDNNDLIINSINKQEFKQKVRLRSYKEVNDNDLVFLEVKKKYKKIVYKRRIHMTLKEFNDYYYKDIYPEDNQILKEIDYIIKYYKLKPYIFLGYSRLSYYSKEDKNFRLTIDSNLRSRKTNLSLKDTKDNKFYFKEKIYIMEVKSINGLPLWFRKFINKNKIYPSSFSKIGNIYKKERGYDYDRKCF